MNVEIREDIYSSIDAEVYKKIKIRQAIIKFIFNYNSSNTRVAYINDLNEFFSFQIKRGDESFDLNSVTLYSIIAYKNVLLSKYSQRTINRKLSSISAFFHETLIDGLIKENPCIRLKRLPNPENFTTPDLSDEEVREGLKKVEASKDIFHIITIYLLVYTGMRANEILLLELSCIIKNENDFYFKIITKGNHQRFVYIHEELVKKIIDLINVLISIGIISDRSFISSLDDIELSEYNWISLILSKVMVRKLMNEKNLKEKNNKSSISMLNYCIKKYIKESGSPHQFRSTVIGRLIDLKIDITRIADFVGHKSIVTTQKYYKRKNFFKNNAGKELYF